MILKTELENQNNSKFGTQGGKKTKDCIFLLSESEVRQFLPTADARKSVYIRNDNISCMARWWLRTPSGKGSFGMLIRENGTILADATTIDSWHNVFVRPACWIQL